MAQQPAPGAILSQSAHEQLSPGSDFLRNDIPRYLQFVLGRVADQGHPVRCSTRDTVW